MSQSYSATTHAVRVDVEPAYNARKSAPESGEWIFIYSITITNMGEANLQLVERSWEITDANGRVERVRGPGVVGKQPILKKGEIFRYTSACPLGTSSGFMAGHYIFTDGEGQRFEVTVPTFSLDVPGEAGALN